jgi:Holliday junction DNA helicase RuvA
MIGRIKGLLAGRDAATILVDVAGVGYEVEVTATAQGALPAVGEPVTLHTHLVVREDAHTLFGFHTPGERDLFRSLIKVSGIGPRLAVTLLSGIDAHEFARCVREGDAARLTSLPGIGKKTAERVILELKDRIDAMIGAPAAPVRSRGNGAAAIVAEAEQALIALGYRPVEASRAVDGAFAPGRSTAEVVRAALRHIGARDGGAP